MPVYRDYEIRINLNELIEKASQTGPTQTIRIEQAPIKISTDDKSDEKFTM